MLSVAGLKLVILKVPLECPIFCTGWSVSVAQRVLEVSRRRRGCGEVESVLCFPLLHTLFSLRVATSLVLAICSRAKSVDGWCCSEPASVLPAPAPPSTSRRSLHSGTRPAALS